MGSDGILEGSHIRHTIGFGGQRCKNGTSRAHDIGDCDYVAIMYDMLERGWERGKRGDQAVNFFFFGGHK